MQRGSATEQIDKGSFTDRLLLDRHILNITDVVLTNMVKMIIWYGAESPYAHGKGRAMMEASFGATVVDPMPTWLEHEYSR